jgi:acyl carrier protein
VTDADETLHGCFAVTFPDLPAEQIPAATVDTVTDWDSLHALVLVALIEEAFSVRIPAGDYPQLRSFAAIAQYLTTAAADGT